MEPPQHNHILITGGSGFLGSAIAECILERQVDAVVSILDPRPPAASLLARHPERLRHYADTLDGFITSAKAHSFSTVIHLAWATLPATSMSAPAEDVALNLVPGVRLLERCTDWTVRRFLFASSGGTVYGVLQSDRADESHPTQPISIYGASKLAFEHYASAIAANRGFAAINLRVANPYGAYQLRGTPIGSIANFLLAAHKREPIHIFGQGEVVRDYIDIEDVASAFYSAATSDLAPGVYNIGTGTGASLNDIVSVIERVTERPVQVERRPARAFDVPRVVLDCRRFGAAANWRVRDDLEAGIRRMWASLVATSPALQNISNRN